MLVKKAYLDLQHPPTSNNKKYPSLIRESSKLIGTVTGYMAFSTSDQLLLLREERHDKQKSRDDTNEEKLKKPVK